MGIRASNIYDAKSKARFDLAFVTLIILLAVFATLSVLSLVAFSRLIPWMKAELKLFDVASEANLWTWANVAVLVSAANVHLACAFCDRQSTGFRFYGWLASSFLLFIIWIKMPCRSSASSGYTRSSPDHIPSAHHTTGGRCD